MSLIRRLSQRRKSFLKENSDERSSTEDAHRLVLPTERGTRTPSPGGVVMAGCVTDITVNHGDVFFNSIENKSFARGNSRCSTPGPIKEQDIELIELDQNLRLVFSLKEAWILPFPWLTNQRYEAEDYFVRLDLEELDRSGRNVKKTGAQIEDLFDPLPTQTPPGNKLPRRILLQGEPGYGKTTLCIKIAYDWAVNSGKFQMRACIVVFLRLRSLTMRLDEAVLQFCKRNISEDIAEMQLKRTLGDLGQDLILLLDGLDETAPQFLDSVLNALGDNEVEEKASFLRGATILVTSRPVAITSKIGGLMERYARIQGLTSVDTFINTYFKSTSQGHELIEKLKTRSFTSTWSPLLLYVVCFLHENESLQQFDNEQETMEAILSLLAKRCFDREGFNYSLGEVTTIYLKLGELFYKAMSDQKLFLTESELTTAFPKVLDFVKSCGVLKRPPAFDTREETGFEPLHKNFVEHLVCRYLNNRWKTRLTEKSRMKMLSNLVLEHNGRNGKLITLDNGTDGLVYMWCLVYDQSLAARMSYSKSATAPTMEVVRYPEISDLAVADQCFRSQGKVHTRGFIILRDMEHLNTIPLQFKKGVEYFYNSHNDRLRMVYTICRPCRCTLEPENLGNTDLFKGPKIASMEYRENRIDCLDCKDSHKKTIDLLIRSSVNCETMSVTCPLLFIRIPSFLEKVLHSAYSLGTCVSVQYIEGGGMDLSQLLNILLRICFRCKKTAIRIQEDSKVEHLLNQLIAAVFTSSFKSDITVSFKMDGSKFTFILNPNNLEPRFFYQRSQRDSTVTSQDMGAVARFTNSKPGTRNSVWTMKGKHFNIKVTVTATNTCLILEDIEDLPKGDLQITYQIFKNDLQERCSADLSGMMNSDQINAVISSPFETPNCVRAKRSF